MALKKKSNDSPEAPGVAPISKPAPVMFRVTNKRRQPQEIPLIDGTTIRLGAWHPQKTDHISAPIPAEKLLLVKPDGKDGIITKMKKRGEIDIEEVQ